jgi:hypothetical protein
MGVEIVPEHYRDPLPNPIIVLEELLARAGLSLVEATPRYSFFSTPRPYARGARTFRIARA